MKLTKSMLVAGAITTVALGSLAGTTLASAHSNTNSSSIVDKIAETFSLNRDDVQEVFDEVHDEKHQVMEEKRAEHIASLVEDGIITQEQADALKEKHEELETARESLKNQELSREEMHNQMDALKDEFESWADEQEIDLEAIKLEKNEGFRHKGHRNMHNNMEGLAE